MTFAQFWADNGRTIIEVAFGIVLYLLKSPIKPKVEG
jgi:hypothetical protein